jgi:hypothetical protein
MKSRSFTLTLLCLCVFNLKAQLFIGEKSKLSFFSSTSLENIDAVNSSVKPLFNSKTGAFAIQARQTDFKFKSSFMQEHYNENYIESEKFPFAVFIGKVNEGIDYTRDGVYEVSMTGKLSMHGVELPRVIKGTITIKGEAISMDSKFDVKVADHNIKVPTLYVAKIAEVIEVTFHSEMVQKK